MDWTVALMTTTPAAMSRVVTALADILAAPFHAYAFRPAVTSADGSVEFEAYRTFPSGGSVVATVHVMPVPEGTSVQLLAQNHADFPNLWGQRMDFEAMATSLWLQLARHPAICDRLPPTPPPAPGGDLTIS